MDSDLASNYDFALVFKLLVDENGIPKRQSATTKFVIKRLRKQGFETFTYLSVQNDELVVLVRPIVSAFL